MSSDEVHSSVLHQQLYTVSDFLEMAHRPENAQKRLELINGAITEMPPSSHANSKLALWIGSLLITFVRLHKLGSVTGTDGGYKITDRNVFQPDAAFISTRRLTTFKGVVVPIAPDLAVEVISPSESPRDVNDKVWGYLQAGTTVVWCLYPTQRVIDEHRLDEDGKMLRTRLIKLEDTLSADDVLPNFKVSVRDNFSVLDEDENTAEA